MRRIIWSMSVSLDGYMEGPDHDISWSVIDDELHQHFNDWLGPASAFLTGRTTYELMDAYWPTADQEPDASPIIVEFADIWRTTPKVVYSRTLDEVGDNAALKREVDPDAVLALKEQGGGDMSVGGARLGSEFLRLGLVDEIRVYVHPVVIGRGTPMFQPQDVTMSVDLETTRTFGSGVVLLQYRTTPRPPDE